MSQRNSGYARKPRDQYLTPAWVTEALLPHIPARIRSVWEPAAGRGHIASVLNAAGYKVKATDLKTGNDFLRSRSHVEAVITNPPYGLATEFVCHALGRTYRLGGFVAMLLNTDFDHAKRRQHLFGACPQFDKKLVLTRRIVWFTPLIASPSSNHAWFIWDWRNNAKPLLSYYYEDRTCSLTV